MKRAHSEINLPLGEVPFLPDTAKTLEDRTTGEIEILQLLLYGWGEEKLHYMLYAILWLSYRKQSPTLNRFGGSHLHNGARTLYDAGTIVNQEDHSLHTVQELRALVLCILGLDDLTQQLFYRVHPYHKSLFHSKPPPAENLAEFKKSLYASSMEYIKGEIPSDKFISEMKRVYTMYSKNIVTAKQALQTTSVRYLDS